MTYFGRLDPMAEGVLLIGAGEETKNRDKYLNLPKTYLFDILWCFETDSFDILGLITKIGLAEDFSEERLKKFIDKLSGKRRQKFPRFSSKPINGRPLFEIAKAEGIAEADLPSKEIEIYKVEYVEERVISDSDLERNIIQKISRVKGDFRQKEIVRKWQDFFENYPPRFFHVSRVRIDCSSGTYIRGIIHSLGKKMATGAIALRIIREKVGEYDIQNSLR